MSSGPYAAPWSGIGRVQCDIDNLNSQLHRKADSHEVYALNSKVNSLERSVRELSSSLDGLRAELQALQENFRQTLDVLSQMTSVL